MPKRKKKPYGLPIPARRIHYRESLIEPETNEKSAVTRGSDERDALHAKVRAELEWCREQMKDPDEFEVFVSSITDCIDATLMMQEMNLDGVTGKKRAREERDLVVAIKRDLEKLSPATVHALWTIFDHSPRFKSKGAERRQEGNRWLIADCEEWLGAVCSDKQVELRWPRELLKEGLGLLDQFATIKTDDDEILKFCYAVISCAYENKYSQSAIRKWVKAFRAKRADFIFRNEGNG